MESKGQMLGFDLDDAVYVPVARALPTHTSWGYVLAAELLAALIGLVAGVLPVRHAAYLDPIEALRAE
jgi:putative ABC transport system permease protein